MPHKLDLLLGLWDILDIWDLTSLTAWTCWCHIIEKCAEQSHFKETDFSVCLWNPYICLLKAELAGEVEQTFPLQHCSAHWSLQADIADIADGSLCLRLSQHGLPSKNIQQRNYLAFDHWWWQYSRSPNDRLLVIYWQNRLGATMFGKVPQTLQYKLPFFFFFF